MSRVSALTRKSIADVTFRRGRSLLVICGIMIGILGLTAVNSASSTIGNAFAYTQDQSAVPDLAYSAIQAASALIIFMPQNKPNIVGPLNTIHTPHPHHRPNSPQHASLPPFS